MGIIVGIVILIIAFIYLTLDNVTDKVKQWYLTKKLHKQNKQCFQYIAICNEKAMNTTLKNNMDRLEVPTPDNYLAIIIFASSIEDLKEFLNQTYGNLHFLITAKRYTDSTYRDLKRYVEYLKTRNMSMAKVCWDNFLKQDKIISNNLSKPILKNTEQKEIKDKYYCVRCFKEISYENYRLYDSMCEQCLQEELLENNLL